MKNEHNRSNSQFAKIKVIGFGGCGSNTISRLHAFDFDDIELIAANTDYFSLSQCTADTKIHLGKNTTQGLGAGGDLNLGKIAAEESFRELISIIKDADLVFLTAGLGGGTGSGAIEIGARIAASYDIPTITFVTLPFSFESDKRVSTAYEATLNLQPFTKTLITIPNDKILQLSDEKVSISDALGMADSILLNSILGLRDLISNSGAMNIDISHILQKLERNNGVFISRGSGIGEDRIQKAIMNSLKSKLIDENPTENAKTAIIKFTGEISIHEVNVALDFLRKKTSPDIQITPIIEELKASDGLLSVSIMLTGLGATPVPIHFIQKQEINMEEKLLVENDLSDQNQDVISDSQFDDDLEIPAFLRRGYNPDNRA